VQAAIVVIVFGAVCALVGFFMGEHTGYQEGKRSVYKEQWEAAGKAFDDLICEHPHLQSSVDPYRRLLDDIQSLDEAKLPPEWE